MTKTISALFFDMEGTLRRSIAIDEESKKQAIRHLLNLIELVTDEEQFSALLAKRSTAYKNWSKQTLLQLNEKDLWTKWMLPEMPPDKIGKIAIELNQTYRNSLKKHEAFPETREVIIELFRRGYHLGLVSNTSSSIEAPRLLVELSISGCFEVIILSSLVGIRKPDPAILLGAAQRIDIHPRHCVYIGNNLECDVVAARKAGFAKVIFRNNNQQLPSNIYPFDLEPDYTISDLSDLLKIFPGQPPVQSEKTYQVSLSTMWQRTNFPTLNDFLISTRRLGFQKIELNHQVNSAMIAEMDITHTQISSIHEPCPADMTVEELKKRDWLISSLNEGNRQEGVKAVQRSIDLAYRLGAFTVVIHSGTVEMDRTVENRLRKLFELGLTHSVEYQQIQEQLIARRQLLAPPRFESVKKSIRELTEYADRFGVRLGLENRYYFMEFPSPEELDTLLSLSREDHLGYIYDVGHAYALAKLGFYPFDDWLKRFSKRLFGVHLHDVIGISDHHIPGKGEVDFTLIARYLPENTLRTCEFQNFNSFEDVKASLIYLKEHGCIREIVN
jgi:HAD superfamily hydrolase (TIGR01549 family)